MCIPTQNWFSNFAETKKNTSEEGDDLDYSMADADNEDILSPAKLTTDGNQNKTSSELTLSSMRLCRR
jgi:hypothetical protein